MTVFKVVLKIVNNLKVPIIMYTAMLVFFGGLNMRNSDSTTNFVATKPDVVIVNEDDSRITDNLVKYIADNSIIEDIKDTESDRDDALFYREVNYMIYIPKNYGEDFINNKNPQISIKSTGDYQASLAEMMLSRYMKVANLYLKSGYREEELIKSVNDTINKQVKVSITSKIDVTTSSKAALFFSFANYCLIAGCVYVIGMILANFNNEKIKKRNIISSMNYRVLNRKLLSSISLFGILMWFMYVVLSIIMIGDFMFTKSGYLLMINSFVFTFTILTISFLIGNLLTNKETINGVVNVLGLGTSFLCGAFVPMQWLPDAVVQIAHILPPYYYIKNNDLISKLEIYDLETLKPILINMGILIAFGVAFIIIANLVTKKKRKIN